MARLHVGKEDLHKTCLPWEKSNDFSEGRQVLCKSSERNSKYLWYFVFRLHEQFCICKTLLFRRHVDVTLIEVFCYFFYCFESIFDFLGYELHKTLHKTCTEQFEFRNKFELFRPAPTLDTHHFFIKSNVNAFYSIVMNWNMADDSNSSSSHSNQYVRYIIFPRIYLAYYRRLFLPKVLCNLAKFFRNLKFAILKSFIWSIECTSTNNQYTITTSKTRWFDWYIASK